MGADHVDERFQLSCEQAAQVVPGRDERLSSVGRTGQLKPHYQKATSASGRPPMALQWTLCNWLHRLVRGDRPGAGGQEPVPHDKTVIRFPHRPEGYEFGVRILGEVGWVRQGMSCACPETRS
jgi:hypothetical protein